MCLHRFLRVAARVESVFLGGSHRKSLPEHFPLNCVTNSAHGRGFLLPSPSWPSLLLLSPVGKACAWLSEHHILHPPRVPPPGLPYAPGSRKFLCLNYRRHIFWIFHCQFFLKQINFGCFSDSLLTTWHSVPAKEQMWACKMSLLYLG